MPEAPKEFTGYAAMTEADGKALNTKPWSYTPPKWSEDCVDIKVAACGICGSCLHTITNGWGGSKYPCVVGHEVVGEVVRAGKNTEHKVGDRVGVGAQCAADLQCKNCKANEENHCVAMCGTYQGSWPVDDKEYTKGGYADYVRAYGRLAVPIPKELDSNSAAPMMCGGVTTYTPLVENGAAPGKTVGIVGVGGLGHYGLLWSVALGAKTYAISHSHSKEQDVYKMGVPKGNFIATSDGSHEEVAKKWANTFDLLIVTSNQKNPPIADLYVPMLAVRGKIVFVGLAEEPLPRIPPSKLTSKSISIGGSIIGSPQQIKDMLALAVKHNIKGWTEVRPMSETSAALKDMQDGKARYRYVLTNE